MPVPLTSEMQTELNELLEWYLSGWGPVKWRRPEIESERPDHDQELGRMLFALSEVEADSKMMRKKVGATGGDKVAQLQEFIIAWLAEEGEHGRALSHLANRYGVFDLDDINARRLTRDVRSFMTWPSLYLSRSITGMCAVYTTLGAMQELVALTTYRYLARLVDDRSSQVLLDIARQESHHMRFYRNAAAIFLRNSKQAQQATRILINRLWRPPGMDLLGSGSFEQIFDRLLSNPEYAQALTVADRIASDLPGLGQVRVMRSYLERNGFRIAETTTQLETQ